MSQPSAIEMIEYNTLRNEFKDSVEATKHPHLSGLANLSIVVQNMDRDDPTRKQYERLMRYDRYLELRMLCAPYFYDLLEKNGVKP